MKYIKEKLGETEQKLKLLKARQGLTPDEEKQLNELSGYFSLYLRFLNEVRDGKLLISDLSEFKKSVSQFCHIVEQIV